MEISCIVIDDEPHAILELADLIERTPGIYMLDSFYDIDHAVAFLSSHEPVDVIFSDIQLPKLNGISGAGILRKYCDYLVYVTAHRNFALDAFGAYAIGYLVKPVSQRAMVRQVTELRENLKKRINNQTKDMAFVKGARKNTFIKLEWSNVIYIEALLNYVNIQTTKGAEVTYLGLKAVSEFLKKQDHFFRISKSIIINLDFIERVDGNLVRMAGDISFTVGDKYRGAFHEFLRKRTLNP